jgi:hypothetical protein
MEGAAYFSMWGVNIWLQDEALRATLDGVLLNFGWLAQKTGALKLRVTTTGSPTLEFTCPARAADNIRFK